MIKIKLHEEDCDCCGACAMALPDVFEMGEHAMGLKKKKASDNLFGQLKDIVKNCPADAIELVDG